MENGRRGMNTPDKPPGKEPILDKEVTWHSMTLTFQAVKSKRAELCPPCSPCKAKCVSEPWQVEVGARAESRT